MQTIADIRRLLEERGLRLRRRLGQHFLHDQNLLRKLVDAAALQAGELVLEIGPGTGTLTEALVDAGAEVIAGEIDEDLAAIVEHRLAERVHLIAGDCLARGRTLQPAIVQALADRPFKLVSNLPYQVASPLICAVLMDHPTCGGLYVTIQREVADRLMAAPGGKAYGPLTIIVQALAEVRRIAVVRPTCFWPPPRVTSAMVAIVPRADHGVEDPAALARFVTSLFSGRRKKLGTTLGRDDPLPKGISFEARPDALTVEQVVELWKGRATERLSD